MKLITILHNHFFLLNFILERRKTTLRLLSYLHFVFVVRAFLRFGIISQ